MMPIHIVLTKDQVSQCAHIGCLRRLGHIFPMQSPLGGRDAEKLWDIDINGAIGEYAVAQYLGAFWQGTTFDFKAPDVGGLVDARATLPDRRLILKKPEHDPPDRPFVLVWLDLPHVWLQGWTFAGKFQRPEFWTDPKGGRPNYFIRHGLLSPMDELRDWCALQPPSWVRGTFITSDAAE